MEIADREETRVVESEEELESFLMRRFAEDSAKVNSFWLAHPVVVMGIRVPEENRFPCLSILVRDMLAYCWFTPSEDCAGFNSLGTVNWIEKDGYTQFSLDGQEQPVPNSEVITFVQAVRVAKEFLHSKELPKSINWSGL